MTERDAIRKLNEHHDFYEGDAFNAGFGTSEVSMTKAAEWLMDEQGVSEDYAYEWAYNWHEQLPEKYRTNL